MKTKKEKPKILIGFYEDINGKNAIPLDDVKPTKAEIFAIIRYHAELMRSVEGMFAMGQSGSWEIRQLPYSNKRVEYYSQFVDKEEVDKIFEEVYKGFNKKE